MRRVTGQWASGEKCCADKGVVGARHYGRAHLHYTPRPTKPLWLWSESYKAGFLSHFICNWTPDENVWWQDDISACLSVTHAFSFMMYQ